MTNCSEERRAHFLWVRAEQGNMRRKEEEEEEALVEV